LVDQFRKELEAMRAGQYVRDMSELGALGGLDQSHAEILSAWNRQDAEAYARQFRVRIGRLGAD
jgi:hypothetical protein